MERSTLIYAVPPPIFEMEHSMPVYDVWKRCVFLGRKVYPPVCACKELVSPKGDKPIAKKNSELQYTLFSKEKIYHLFIRRNVVTNYKTDSK